MPANDCEQPRTAGTMEVIMRFQFEAHHRWKDAPPGSMLAEYHRHMMHVEARIMVCHDDREVEIITMRRSMLAYMSEQFGGWTDHSCETMARALVTRFDCSQATVLEDGENGATFTPDRRTTGGQA